MTWTRHYSCVLGALLLGWAAPAVAADPVVTLKLGPADAHAVPTKHGKAHTGGGNIDVRQPAPDTLYITLTGVAVAGCCPVCDALASLEAELCQEFAIACDPLAPLGLKLELSARAVGLLRNPCLGTAELNRACATVSCDGADQDQEIATLCIHPVAAGCKENRSVYAREGPVCVPVVPGCYRLRQTLTIGAAQSKKGSMAGHAAAAEFAPSPALDPTWICYSDPFHGVVKKDFGFQVTVRVVPVTTVSAP